ncbi:MAG: delta-aminolevulinic acid dehydratase [Gammaproteobacteria bacterium]|nr:delta-aminolevulinic acid dehydratase [Gammaproteobacteria bacterium]
MPMIADSFSRLRAYCETEDYRGWDPYDGLNSAIFQATPLKHWDIARLVLIQLCKRSPVNLRPLLRVPKQHNAKGIGLFLSGYCNLYKLVRNGDTSFGSQDELRGRIETVAELLLGLQSKGYSGACWGYNFDWQARRLFFFPAHTPTVVATSFCATALFSAYEATGNSRYLETALSSGQFVLRDLNRRPCDNGFLLSYSPMKENDSVYNASLLGAKLLSFCYHHTADDVFRDTARQIVSAVCAGQGDDGSWIYGLLPAQSWIDSFHTGYNLDGIAHYMRLCDDPSFATNLEEGLDFYIRNFFLADGTPKYYHNRTYPIDIQCPGQLLVTAHVLGQWPYMAETCRKVLAWTIRNMQDERGYFYYQLKEGISSKLSYMRWSNAFMFNALSHYFLAESAVPSGTRSAASH